MNRAIINGKTSAVECKACGASEPLRLPASIEDFCEQGKVFGKAHELCDRDECANCDCSGVVVRHVSDVLCRFGARARS